MILINPKTFNVSVEIVETINFDEKKQKRLVKGVLLSTYHNDFKHIRYNIALCDMTTITCWAEDLFDHNEISAPSGYYIDAKIVSDDLKQLNELFIDSQGIPITWEVGQELPTWNLEAKTKESPCR